MQFKVDDCDKNKIGVYRITNLVNSHSYVGKTINMQSRYRQHLHCMKNPDTATYSKLLRFAAKKYGVENFVFEVIAITPTEELAIEVEKAFLVKDIKPEYNIADSNSFRVTEASTRQVIQYSCSGDFLKIYANIHEAADVLGTSYTSIKGAIDATGEGPGARTASGFVWRSYQDDPPMIIDPIIPGARITQEWVDAWGGEYSIKKWSLKGDFIIEYYSPEDFTEKTSLTLKELRRHISGKYLTLKGHVYTVNDSEPSFPSSIRNLPVRKFDRNGVLLETYQNAKLAAIGVGLSYHSVWDALSLHHGTNKAGGTFWAYDDGTVFKKVVTESNRRQVVVFNKADDKVDQLLCVQDFVKKYGIDRNTVYSKLLKTGAIHRTKKIGVRYATEYDEKI